MHTQTAYITIQFSNLGDLTLPLFLVLTFENLLSFRFLRAFISPGLSVSSKHFDFTSTNRTTASIQSPTLHVTPYRKGRKHFKYICKIQCACTSIPGSAGQQFLSRSKNTLPTSFSNNNEDNKYSRTSFNL